MRTYRIFQLERAAFLMLITKKGVKRIAGLMGCTDITGRVNWKDFSNQFKHRFGEHPTPWKQQMLKRYRQKIKSPVTLRESVVVGGKGFMGVSLINRQLLGCQDFVIGWRVMDLKIENNEGIELSRLESPTSLSKDCTFVVDATTPPNYRKPQVRLLEGMEIIEVELWNGQGIPRRDVQWEVTLELSIERHHLLF